MIKELSPEARQLWDDAKSRELDIGIESGRAHKFYWFALSPKAIRSVAEVNAQIAVTIYGPLQKAKPKKKRESGALKPARIAGIRGLPP